MDKSRKSKAVSVSLISGGLSGLASCLLLQPLDLLKTRLQQTEHLTRPTGSTKLLTTARTVVASEGVLGLWKGTAPTVARNVPGVALYFTVLTHLRRNVSRPDSIVAAVASTAKTAVPGAAWPRLSAAGDVLTGASARVAVGFILMPITVVKARAESSLYPHASISARMVAIVRVAGIKGLWQGFVPTALRDGPYAGLFILSYERAKAGLDSARLGIPKSARDSAAGALGAVAATLMTAPFDTVKTKRQLRPDDYPNIARSLVLIASRKGALGFFEGAGLRMARKAGSSAIAYSLYEGLISRYSG